MSNQHLEVSEVGYPYATGNTECLSVQQWSLILLSVLLAVGLLLGLPALFGGNGVATKVSIVVFAIVPFGTLCWASKDNGNALFRGFNLKVIGQIIGFGLLTFILSVSCALLMIHFIDTAPNQSVHGLKAMSEAEQGLFFLFSVLQLFGEEMITILPFLAIMYFCHHYWHMTQTQAVLVAWVSTAVWFSLIHLPAYNWNLVQVLWGIGFARLLLTAAFIFTKNMWVATGAHILNDWLIFSLTIFATSKTI